MTNFHRIKYIRLIKTFSEEELKSFDLWLRSPWCNTNKNIIRLLEKLKKYHPNYDDPKLTKEKLFKKILPNGKFSDRRMNNIFSEGYLAAERFVIFQNLMQNQNLKKDLYTKELQSRRLEDLFFKDSDKEIERLESKEIKDWEDHIHLLRLHRRVYHHPNQSLRMKPVNVTLDKMNEPIDMIYLLEKAAVINEKIFRNRLIKGENHDVTIDLKKWRALSENVEDSTVQLYRMRFDYTETNMIEQYYTLRQFFLDNFEELNEKEKKIHFFSLVNDTSKLIKKGVFNIIELLPLYKLGLKSEILFVNSTLSSFTFIMIVIASNTKKDFTYTNSFIDTYTYKLESNAQKDGFYWAKAHTAYYQNELQECLNHLLNHHFNLQYFQQISKVLTTQVYFDLYLQNDSYQSYLFNYFDSFEKWLQREIFQSKNVKKSFLRFVQMSRIIAKSYGDINFRPDKLKNLLNSESNIQAFDWLKKRIEKVIELKNKRLLKD